MIAIYLASYISKRSLSMISTFYKWIKINVIRKDFSLSLFLSLFACTFSKSFFLLFFFSQINLIEISLSFSVPLIFSSQINLIETSLSFSIFFHLFFSNQSHWNLFLSLFSFFFSHFISFHSPSLSSHIFSKSISFEKNFLSLIFSNSQFLSHSLKIISLKLSFILDFFHFRFLSFSISFILDFFHSFQIKFNWKNFHFRSSFIFFSSFQKSFHWNCILDFCHFL